MQILLPYVYIKLVTIIIPLFNINKNMGRIAWPFLSFYKPISIKAFVSHKESWMESIWEKWGEISLRAVRVIDVFEHECVSLWGFTLTITGAPVVACWKLTSQYFSLTPFHEKYFFCKSTEAYAKHNFPKIGGNKERDLNQIS